MIQTFADQGTQDIFDGVASKAARKKCSHDLWKRARRKLDDLRVPRSNNLHPLKGNRAGQWAIAINDQYRICFRWEGTDALEVEITDYH